MSFYRITCIILLGMEVFIDFAYTALISYCDYIFVYRCYFTRVWPKKYTPPYHCFKLRPWSLVNEIGSPIFGRFFQHVHSFIMVNHYFTFIRKINFFQLFLTDHRFSLHHDSPFSVNFFHRHSFLDSPFKPIFR